jgi:hypothetical protein
MRGGYGRRRDTAGRFVHRTHRGGFSAMDTRSIAVIALVLAVIILLILLL